MQNELDAEPSVPSVEVAAGPARIETFTVKQDRAGVLQGIIVGRLDSGERFLATTAPDDDAMVDLLFGDEPFGARIGVTNSDGHNYASIR